MSDKQKYCTGCRDNFYNGNNPYGVTQCWSLEKAKVVWRKFIRMDDRPPWNHQKTQRTLDCHRRPGFIKVEANRTH